MGEGVEEDKKMPEADDNREAEEAGANSSSSSSSDATMTNDAPARKEEEEEGGSSGNNNGVGGSKPKKKRVTIVEDNNNNRDSNKKKVKDELVLVGQAPKVKINLRTNRVRELDDSQDESAAAAATGDRKLSAHKVGGPGRLTRRDSWSFFFWEETCLKIKDVFPFKKRVICETKLCSWSDSFLNP